MAESFRVPPWRTGGTDSVEPDLWTGWRIWVPLAFVLLSLVLLLLIPVMIQRKSESIRDEIDAVAEPARILVDGIEAALSAEAAAALGYALTHDSVWIERYRRARAEEQSLLTRLVPFVELLGPEARTRFQEIRRVGERWRAGHEAVFAGRVSGAEYMASFPEREARYSGLLAAVDRLKAAITGRQATLRTESRRIVAVGVVLTALMTVLVLLSGLFLVRLGRGLRRRAIREAELRDTALVLTEPVGVDEVLGRIVESAVYRNSVDSSFVERILPGSQEVEVVAATGPLAPPVGTRVRYPGSLTAETAESDAPQVVTDVSREARPISRILARSCGRCAALVVPLVSGDAPQGALVALRDAGRRPFRADEVLQIRILGVLAALALRRAVLLEEAERRRSEAEQRARAESALREAAASIAGMFGIDEVVREVVESARQAADADGAFVLRLEPGDDEMQAVASTGEWVPPQGWRTMYTGSISEAVMEGHAPVVLHRLADADAPFPRPVTDGCPDCSAVVLHLTDAGGAIGTLFLVRAPGRDPFGPEALTRAETLASLAALGFRKIHLLRDAERRREELQRLMASRDHLMRGFSHDLKNPLGAALGYLDLLELEMADGLTEEQAQRLGRIRSSIGSALRLIEDLLDMARAEKSRIEIEPGPVDLRAAAQEAADEFRAQAEAKGLEVQTECPAELPIVRTDRSRVHQVLGNLVTNAVKYTDEGCVTLRVGLCEEGEPDGPGPWVRVDVADTGPGIPEEKRHLLFQEFARLGRTDANGAGLGLAISRRIARALGGDISVESAAGQGSTFTLWLPLDAEHTVGKRD